MTVAEASQRRAAAAKFRRGAGADSHAPRARKFPPGSAGDWWFEGSAAYDRRGMEMPRVGSSPGLVKIRSVPLVQRRRVELCNAHDGRFRDILASADVMSEGRVSIEGGVLVYHGTTSVILLRRSHGGALPDPDVDALAAVLKGDPHLRLRALRVAHREATARAGSPLGSSRAELRVDPGARGVVISIEISASVERQNLAATAAR